MKSLRRRTNSSNEQYVEFRNERGRVLSPEELATLISTTWDGPVRFGMTGPERSMFYRLASELRLTVAELRLLTPASVQLGSTPAVCVPRGDKARRHARFLALGRETARELASFLIVPEPDQPVFRIPNEFSEMLRADVQAARASTGQENQAMDADAGRASTTNRRRDRQP